MPLTHSEFLAAVEADRIEREANPPPRAPDPYEAFGEEIDRHPVGIPFCRSLRAIRRLKALDVAPPDAPGATG